MDDLSLPEVRRLVDAANAVRWPGDAPGSVVESGGFAAGRRLDAFFGTSHKLAVYGTLAPGQPNHHIVEPLGGEWTDGLIEGDLFPVGWGAVLGYPAFRPRVGGPAVAVQVLTAPLLATAWFNLDRFEGPEYQRILVPVFSADLNAAQSGERRLYTVANLYAATEAGK
ncbi:MAG TPA: gamma-glutamylcyclotransferase family protein [Thermoanaerobaculia bacterium]